MIYVYYTLTAIVTFFAWALIHEMSHVIALKKTVGLQSYKLFLYPHMHNKRFYWARIRYMPTYQPSSKQQFIISMAPRVPDYVGVLLLSLIAWFVAPALWSELLVLFLAGSLVDLFVGSLGISKSSDLQVASRAVGSKFSVWNWRVAQAFLLTFTTANVVHFFTNFFTQ